MIKRAERKNLVSTVKKFHDSTFRIMKQNEETMKIKENK